MSDAAKKLHKIYDTTKKFKMKDTLKIKSQEKISCPFLQCSKEVYSISTKSPFFRCSKCMLIFNTDARKALYEKNYFNTEYKSQYKLSYYEDKKNIQKRMKQRMNWISKYLPIDKKKRLLEIGSAAGYFLEIAKEKKIEVEGWEISESMADYANNRNLYTRNGDFFEIYQNWKKNKEAKFDLIAAFYVIEHFPDQAKVWKAFSNLITPGGYLLLSLPSCFGPMFYFQQKEWTQNHPKDHFVNYSPVSIEKIGKEFYFDLIFKKAEGIHPERFFGGNLPLLNRIYSSLQKELTFSDTFFTCLKYRK